MAVAPAVRYARSGGVNIAYQVVGDAPLSLLFVPGWASHIECFWEEPIVARFFRRLSSFARLILFDKRGTGLSDPVSPRELPTLEQRMDDVRAVLDAAGSERAAVLGFSEGGVMSALFAATYPERTSALVLWGSAAKFTRSPDHAFGGSPEALQAFQRAIEQTWGGGDMAALFAPSLTEDHRYREWWARFERQGASPGTALALFRMLLDIDIRHVLPAIRVPTLVLHRSDDTVIEIGQGRYLAQNIPGARFLELPGVDHQPWAGDADHAIDEIEEFLTGIRQSPATDRVLATILFTDIVGSTRRAAHLGDRSWSDLLDAHDEIVRAEVERLRGSLVATTGDGVLATFDGPGRAIRCACAMSDALWGLGLEIRAGLHTGEVETRGEDIAGLALHIAHRVMSSATPGEILVSHTVRDLVAGSGIRFGDRGAQELKGVPGRWSLLSVEALDEASERLRPAVRALVAATPPEIERVDELARLAELRDDVTGLHIVRMSNYAARLARASGMGEAEEDRLMYATRLHDIGKIGVPDSVLLKPGPLSDEEWQKMRGHPVEGAKQLSGSSSRLIQLAEIIALTHHERWDGNGYPRGLEGEEIPLAGRVCALADAFDALTTPRPYKEAWLPEDALSEIRSGAGKHFDPALVELFVQVFPEILELFAGFVELAHERTPLRSGGPPLS